MVFVCLVIIPETVVKRGAVPVQVVLSPFCSIISAAPIGFVM